MAIEGLRAAEVRVASDEAGAAVEALDMLGLVEDRERVAESVAADFAALNESAQVGEKFIQVPRSIITLAEMVQTLDDGSYESGETYPKTYVDDELWTPGNHASGYKADDIGNLVLGAKNGNWPAHARIAITNPDSTEEPLLHFLNQPYDEKYAEEGEETQLETLGKVRQDFEVGQSEFAMTPLNVPAVTMIALMRRIKGEAMPMEWGFMRDGTVPRATFGARSYVGSVDSDGGQLELDGSRGRSRPDGGLGLSVGPKEFESQAS
ncbi:MAG TPA: hypothetical protein VFH99_01640 [Candidatus Saccharimonadales bacterium]|nr:hypothetical protein [Candidatus Saccharimonadales bacterium]